MNNSPQAVTERYISNLLRDGQNAEFAVTSMERKPFCVGEEHCGFYYIVNVMQGHLSGEAVSSVGPTPSSALRNALTKLGVTFR